MVDFKLAPAPFSEAEMRAELAQVIIEFVHDLRDVLTPEAPWRLIGVADRPAPTDLPLDDLPITRHMSTLYDYAFRGISADTGDINDALDPATRFVNERCKAEPERLVCVIDTACARWLLDTEEDHLTIYQVSLLANMDEKSVRNAANPRSKDPLRTTSDGTRTFVRISDARDWLSRRRGFVPTREGTTKELDSLPPQGFASTHAVGVFVKNRRERMRLTPSQLGGKGRQARIPQELVKRVESGDCDIGIKNIVAIGRALRLDPKAFATAVAKATIAAVDTAKGEQE